MRRTNESLSDNPGLLNNHDLQNYKQCQTITQINNQLKAVADVLLKDITE